jgi:hypothetical protein
LRFWELKALADESFFFSFFVGFGCGSVGVDLGLTCFWGVANFRFLVEVVVGVGEAFLDFR